MKLFVYARVGMRFVLDCDPTPQSITSALKTEVLKLPNIEGKTYVPCEGEKFDIFDDNGNQIESSGSGEEIKFYI